MIRDGHNKFTSGAPMLMGTVTGKGPSAIVSVPGVVDAVAENTNTHYTRFTIRPESQIPDLYSPFFQFQSRIFMTYFLALSGSSTKFSKSGFLLRTTASILEQRAIELRAIHAVDLPIGRDTNRDLTEQFIADANHQIQQAVAILLLTPATKESVPTLLITLLERLPDNSFSKKPVLLFATGGLPAHVAFLERALRHELLRLGITDIAARVHLGTGNWITVGNDRPRLSRGAETEVAHSLDLVLRGIRLKERKELTLEFAGGRAGFPSRA
jgi:NAD(P)H-dependent FMN reductase